MDEQVQKKLDQFFGKFREQRYKKGEILIRVDDMPSGVFYLKEGFVKQYTISRKGDEVVVNIFKPISFFPMSWVMNSTPNAYYFEAISDVTVWKAPKDMVIAFLQQEPDVLYDLVKRLYRGIDGALKRMSHLMAENAYARLVTELLIQAKRFGEAKDGKVLVKISETDIAAQSGMTRETVSREMKTLKAKNLVHLEKNGLIIQDLIRLEKELTANL